jgi:hypothetical protein
MSKGKLQLDQISPPQFNQQAAISITFFFPPEIRGISKTEDWKL